MTNFESVIRILSNYITDVSDLLKATDSVLALTEIERIKAPYSHDDLVRIAMGSPTVMEHCHAGKKINAIKELRTITYCGLKEAKDAVEDPRVHNWPNYYG